jgi:hypothetical protein
MQVREAKDFLIRRVVEQARLEDVPLSDLERRMMYFTEGPDAVEDPISLNEEFEKQCDTTEYDAKLTKLLANAHKHLKTDSPTSVSEWNKAIKTLQGGDHYLLVLLWSGSSGRIPLRKLTNIGGSIGGAYLCGFSSVDRVEVFLEGNWNFHGNNFGRDLRNKLPRGGNKTAGDKRSFNARLNVAHSILVWAQRLKRPRELEVISIREAFQIPLR